MGSEAHRAPAVTGDAAAAPAGDSRGIPSTHPTCGHGAPACEPPSVSVPLAYQETLKLGTVTRYLQTLML